MPTRRLLRWLLLLTLLFGQAAAFAHALSHLHTRDSALPDQTCEVCIAHAQLGSAPPPSVIRLIIPAGGDAAPAVAAVLCADLAPRPGGARAPPIPSHA